MKTVRFTINYGGFVGTDEEYRIKVADDATEDEINDAIEEMYEELIHDNCSWELSEEDDD